MKVTELKEKKYRKHLKDIGCTKQEITDIWDNIERRRGIRKQ